MKKNRKYWRKGKNRYTRPHKYKKGLPKERILIVCEGEKTEPNYFRSFRVSSTVILEIKGIGYNTISLVNKAFDLAKEAKKINEKYDQVWCVFDRDSFSPTNFNNAINKAEQKGFKVAYSNEAFELWYLLHFIYIDTAINRNDYIEKLQEYLRHRYCKNSKNIYEEINNKQKTAISNAKKLSV